MSILIILQIVSSRWLSGLAMTEKMIDTSADSIKKGRDYLMAGEYKKAIPFLKQGFQLGWAYENLGEFNTAIKYYKESHPLLESHATYGIARCIKNLGRFDEAIDYYEELANKFPDFVFLNWAMQELGWCYEKIGDYENAIDVWEYEFKPPLSWYKIAQVYNKIGKKSDTLWLNIATKYPESDYACKAISKLPKDSLLLIGKIYYFANKYDSAIDCLDGVKGGEEFLGLSLYKKGDYEEALELVPHINSCAGWFIAGKCNEKLGKVEDAIVDYTKSGTPDALYLKARILENLGKKEEAIFTYCAIPSPSPDFEFSNLRAGLLALEIKKLDIAYKAFRNISPPAGYYWCYRIKTLQGDEWKARLYRQKLLDEYPISYYAWLLGGGSGISMIEPEQWIASNDTSIIAPEEQERFNRGKLLVELGIRKYGTAEFNKLPKKPLLCWRIAKFFHINGMNWLALPYARHTELKGGIPKEIAKVLYPLCFLQGIREAARAQNIDEFLMLALVREESYFNPVAVSPSNAKGLAQIIPPTGKQIARKLGVKNYSLFHPQTNLKFGAFYLGECLETFNGSWECAIASYNAGPHRVKKWIVERDTSKMDEWVEWIPFKETRRYVKKVMKSYYAYKMLYGK